MPGIVLGAGNTIINKIGKVPAINKKKKKKMNIQTTTCLVC